MRGLDLVSSGEALDRTQYRNKKNRYKKSYDFKNDTLNVCLNILGQ